MKTLGLFSLGLTGIALIYLGVSWLLWQLYLFVAQGFWPDGGAWVRPDFWPFLGLMLLLAMIGSFFRKPD